MKKINVIYANSKTIQKIKDESLEFTLTHVNDYYYIVDEMKIIENKYLEDGCILVM